ncbi:MAG: toast rack family protein [Bellilinea sp.]|jgi:hypothetical protein
MKKHLLILPITLLLAASLACSFTVNLPSAQTGETEVLTIQEAAPANVDTVELSIEMGAGELDIQPGAEVLVEGEMHYNIPDWKPEIVRDGNNLLLRQGRKDTLTIPGGNVINRWNLKLGSSLPLDLNVDAGAYKGTLNLTGIPLTNLVIQDGASQAEVRFDEPNPVKMDSLRYRTGASEVRLIGLGNANPSFFTFEGGTGSYTLDFTGSLQQDMFADISAGVSNLRIIIPEGMPARVVISGGLNNIQPRGTWQISNNVYETDGSGYKLEINLNMGLGNLELVSE